MAQIGTRCSEGKTHWFGLSMTVLYHKLIFRVGTEELQATVALLNHEIRAANEKACLERC